MLRLAAIVYIIVGPTVAGIAMITALVAGHTTSNAVIWSVLIGFVLALPVSWVLARQIDSRT